jgi:SAM-dependent methyltransferase
VYPAGSTRSDVFHKEYSLVRCDGCGTGICDPQITDEELHDYYGDEEIVGAGKYQAWIKKYRYIYDWIVRRSGRLQSVFEIGCNSANQLRYFRERGWQTLGFEFSRACQDYARDKNGVEVVGELLSDYHSRQPEQRFDLALLIHTFEHITSPAALLTDIRSMLKSGGLLYIEVPNADSLTYRLMARYENIMCLPYHAYLYTQESLKALLRNHGFDIVAERSCSMKEDGGHLTAVLARWVRLRLIARLGDNRWSRTLANVLRRLIRFYPNRRVLTYILAWRRQSVSFAILARTRQAAITQPV